MPEKRERVDTHQSEYKSLKRFVLRSRGRFALGLVRGNYPPQRDAVLKRLESELNEEGIQFYHLDFAQQEIRSLYEALLPCKTQYKLDGEKPTAVAVTGLEGSIDMGPARDEVRDILSSLNVQRDLLAESFSFPLIIWLNDYAMDLLAEHSPDFQDFFSGLFEFRYHPLSELVPTERMEFIKKEEEEKADIPETVVEERIEILQRTLREGRKHYRTGDRQQKLLLADNLSQIGDIYLNYRDKRSAAKCFKESLKIYEDLSQEKSVVRVMTSLGEAYYWSYQYKEAVEVLLKAVEAYAELGNRLGEANTISSLGEVHLRLAEHTQARERYEQALPIYQEVGSRLGEANAIYRLGNVHQVLAEYPQARERYKQALPIYQEIGSRLGEANTIYSLGDVHLRLAEYMQARERYEQALPIYQEIGARLGEEVCYSSLGEVYRLEKRDYEQALASYQKALEIQLEISDLNSAATTYSFLGKIYWEMQKIEKAREAYQEAIKIYEQIGLLQKAREISETMRSLG